MFLIFRDLPPPHVHPCVLKQGGAVVSMHVGSVPFWMHVGSAVFLKMGSFRCHCIQHTLRNGSNRFK